METENGKQHKQTNKHDAQKQHQKQKQKQKEEKTQAISLNYLRKMASIESFFLRFSSINFSNTLYLC